MIKINAVGLLNNVKNKVLETREHHGVSSHQPDCFLFVYYYYFFFQQLVQANKKRSITGEFPRQGWSFLGRKVQKSEVHAGACRQTSYIRGTKSKNLNVVCLELHLPLPNPLTPGVVENEDVAGAAPTGDAPTTSEWSIIFLPAFHIRLLVVILYIFV